MEYYPEELRTPPISLVSVVGCPELHQTISSFLHAEQPPINTLALPDFSKISVLARKHKDPLASPQPVAGILKRDWLMKHRTRVAAAVAALFRADYVTGDPAQWLQVCTDLENLKAAVHGRSIRLIVILVQTNESEDVSEDLKIALRKRAEIDTKYLITFLQNDASELRQSLTRLASIFAELCNTYYREEGRRIRTRIEKRTFNSVELNIRYCFKVAVYAEFRRDWAEALRFYEEAYRALREMIATSTRLPPVQRLVEIKAVAEQLHFKISTLLLHGGKVVEAIAWFNKHIASYRQLVGSTKNSFLHWDWLSRQFLVFAELLETSTVAIPSTLSSHFGTSENPLTEWEVQPAYYYQLAASYLREKRYCLDSSLSMTDSASANTLGKNPESVLPSVFVGQSARLFEQGDTIEVLPLSDAEYINYAITEAQRFQDSYEIIALFKKAYESFNSLKAPRLASYCSTRMAKEYFIAEDFNNAKLHFDGVSSLYRQEGWVTLLWESLGYLRECSRRLGSVKDFIEYSLEMASLPIFSAGEVETPNSKREYGPAGLPTLSRRESVQNEVFGLLRGENILPLTDGGCSLIITEEQPVRVDVDVISPLRMALLACVAFHDQSVKPGSPTMMTLSLVSQLPCPVEVDRLEIEFNQPKCNFIIVNAVKDLSTAQLDMDSQDVRVENAPSLILPTNKWLRLTYEVKSGQSGKLECLSITAKIGKSFMICCQAESPASMEELPFWKFEDQVETFPTKDPGLTYSGLKVIQVEEPEPQVDLILGASSPALVGETFVVPLTIISNGHEVYSGELKINLVDARGGGLLMSPREAEPFSSGNHHVELLSISGTGIEDESQTQFDNIRKIQQSFGVVSVPVLRVGDSWSCKLEIKWHRPKSVMLYASLGYSPNSTEAASQRVNIHRSLQIEGKIPISISHCFMMPFRREPLLLSKVKSLPGIEEKVSLALNETSVLIVTAQNCSEVPLRVISLSIRSDGDEDSRACSVQHVGGIPADNAPLVPGEEFKGIFSVTSKVDSPNLEVGSVCLVWKRDLKLGDSEDSGVVTEQKLPSVIVEQPPLIVSFDCPPHAILGVPFLFHIRIHNQTNLLQEIKYSLGDCQSFVFSGPHDNAGFVLPKSEYIMSYKIVPLCSGSQQLPQVSITSVRYSAALNPSAAAATIFVYPSEPEFIVGAKKQETILVYLPKNSISAVRNQQSVAPACPTPLLSLLSRGIDPTDRSTSPPVPRLLLWSRTVSSAVGFLFVCLGGDSKNYIVGAFKPPCTISVIFADGKTRKQASIKKDNGRTTMVPIFESKENIVGEVIIEPTQGKKVEHNGIKIELLGQIELYFDKGNFYDFTSLVRELDIPGDLYERKTYPFEFSTVEMPYESYSGINVRLRYILKVTISRNYIGNIVEYQEFCVRNFAPLPTINNSIKMEVGIEDCLHIEFEYSKSKYHQKDVIIGKIYFLLVRIKLKNMELEIRRRESTGSGPNTYVETETLAKYELMDGAPVRGESIPVRLFLSPYELTPTYRNINNKFSVKYYLNLVLMDEEDRRYFKQQEITIYRLLETS
ncbi:unnamed protein product [Musa acuminata subsp. burmannicoides]